MEAQIKNILEEAISGRNQIGFRCEKGGVRIGNPYVIYQSLTGDNLVDIEQTDGFTDKSSKFPVFETFKLADLTYINIRKTNFNVSSDFETNSNRYIFAYKIVK